MPYLPESLVQETVLNEFHKKHRLSKVSRQPDVLVAICFSFKINLTSKYSNTNAIKCS